jgi:hypothetical protein
MRAVRARATRAVVAVCALAACSMDEEAPTGPPALAEAPPTLASVTTTDTLEASADAHTRSAAPNLNYGTADSLTVRSFSNNPTNRFATYVKFDLAAIEAQIGSGTLDSAKLEFYLKAGGGWPTGGDYINAYRIPNSWAPNGWTEAGITTNCPNDTNTGNAQLNCPGGVWDTTGFGLITPTDQVMLDNDTRNWITFDVTADVNAWVNGTANHGWHIAKQNNNNNQRIVFWSREGTYKPRLILYTSSSQPPILYTLSTVRFPGVSGSPNAGEHSYAPGAIVNYNFTAAAGYNNVGVLIDGIVAPASGSITMSTSHILIASADSVVTVSSGDQALVQSARAVLTSSNPVNAYQSYLEDLRDAFESVDASATAERLSAIEFLAENPLADTADMRRVDQALAGRIFTVDSSHVSDSTAEATTILYVNGIFNFSDGAARNTSQQLKSVLTEDTIFRLPSIGISHYYNPWFLAEATEVQQNRARCAAMVERRKRFIGYVSQVILYAHCYYAVIPNPISDIDFFEAMNEWRGRINGVGVTNPHGEFLADKLDSLRTAGRHVILVPHSQGNLLAQHAIDRLRVTYNYSEGTDTVCVGAVSLAAPTDLNWNLPQERLRQFVLAGDLVADVAGNHTPRSENYITAAAEDTLAQIDAWLSLVPANQPIALLAAQTYRDSRSLWLGYTIHKSTSYLVPASTAESIREAVKTVYKDCSAQTIHVSSNGPTYAPVGETRTLSVSIYNGNFEPLLNRKTTYSSSDPAVVSVDTTGTLQTNAIGTAIIKARSGAATGQLTFTVHETSPYPPDVWVFGVWERTADMNGESCLWRLTYGLGAVLKQICSSATFTSTFNDNTKPPFIKGRLAPTSGTFGFWNVGLTGDGNSLEAYWITSLTDPTPEFIGTFTRVQ